MPPYAPRREIVLTINPRCRGAVWSYNPGTAYKRVLGKGVVDWPTG